jgi:hypothetical protein
MKFYLAIAFALLMATAYGFRLRTTEDTCTINEYTTNNEGVCNVYSTLCPQADGSFKTTTLNECEDGSYSNQTMVTASTGTSDNFTYTTYDCQDGKDEPCNECTNDSWTTYADNDSSSYLEVTCIYTNGTTSCKLACLI